MTRNEYDELLTKRDQLEQAINEANQRLSLIKKDIEDAQREPSIRMQLQSERDSIPHGFARRD